LESKIHNPNFLSIRKVTPDDVIVLRNISIQTFLETYGWYNTEENLALYFSNDLSEETFEGQIDSIETDYFFVLKDDVPIGFIKIGLKNNPAQKSNDRELEIERIYILNEFQGFGAGKFLLEYSESIAKRKGITQIWLGVWEKNLKAQEFYFRMGFTQIGEHDFWLGKDQQRDFILVKSIE
jgi:ribosomal protein S18 acetylase RimI-like enzyme